MTARNTVPKSRIMLTYDTRQPDQPLPLTELPWWVWMPHVAGLLLGLAAAIGGVAVHAGGIALRCIIAGRPPVTNMFESVVWVSFGVMAFAFELSSILGVAPGGIFVT